MLDYLHGNVQLVDVFFLADFPIFNKSDRLKIQLTKSSSLTVESIAIPNLSERRFLAASSSFSCKAKNRALFLSIYYRYLLFTCVVPKRNAREIFFASGAIFPKRSRRC
jgi:hypothetical protein